MTDQGRPRYQGPGKDDPRAHDPYGRNPIADDPQAQGNPPARRRRPTALIVILGIVGLCLLICAGVVVYAFTQIGPGIRDSVSGLTATGVAAQLNTVGVTGPGNYVITDQALTDGINQQLAADSGDVRGVGVMIDTTGVEIIVDLGGQTLGYRAGLEADGGEIRLTNPQADAGIIGNLVPTDWIAGGLEDGLNSYFRANDLTVSSVELAKGQVQIATQQRDAEPSN
jgi:hypothetical protein